MDDRARALALDAQERLQRSARRLTPGTLGGRSEQAQAAPRRVPIPTPRGPSEDRSWYLQGSLADYVGTESGRYTPRARGRLIHIVNELVTPGGSDTEIGVLKGGVALTSYTIPSGESFLAVVINEDFTPGVDSLSFTMTSAGSGAAQLTQTAVFA